MVHGGSTASMFARQLALPACCSSAVGNTGFLPFDLTRVAPAGFFGNVINVTVFI